MAAVVYPSTLPGPSLSAVTPLERRALSDVSGGPQQARGLQRDFGGTQRVQWDQLDAAQAAELDAWWTDTLIKGGRWFSSTWPAPAGWVATTRRYLPGRPQWEHLPGGFWRVSADLEIRGRGLAPQVTDPLTGMAFLMHFHGVAGGTVFTEEYGHVVTRLSPDLSGHSSSTTTTTAAHLYGPSSGAFNGSVGLSCPMDEDVFFFPPGPFEMGARVKYVSGSGDIMNCRRHDTPAYAGWHFTVHGFSVINDPGDPFPEEGIVSASPVVGSFAEYLVSRDAANMLRYFVNGELQDEAFCDINFAAPFASFHIGDHNDHTGSGYLVGNIAELWIIPGQARHVANYTPTTTEIPKE